MTDEWSCQLSPFPEVPPPVFGGSIDPPPPQLEVKPQLPFPHTFYVYFAAWPADDLCVLEPSASASAASPCFSTHRQAANNTLSEKRFVFLIIDLDHVLRYWLQQKHRPSFAGGDHLDKITPRLRCIEFCFCNETFWYCFCHVSLNRVWAHYG